MKQNVLHVATTNHPLLIHLCVIMFGLVAVVSLGWLCFIVSRPDQWKEMVDRENDFWVGKGMVSAAVADWVAVPGHRLRPAKIGAASRRRSRRCADSR